MRILRGVVFACIIAACLGALAAAQTPAIAQPQQPTFKAGVNFVRVDVYPSVKGQIVADLKKDEFEIFEDGVPQRIETFEHISIRAPGAEAERAEPRAAEEGNQAAADSRNRLFVLFLDSYHTTIDATRTRVTRGVGSETSSPVRSGTANSRIGRALATFLGRLIGPDDLIAVTRPEMPVDSLSFTRRPSSLEDMLLNGGAWQRRPVADDLYSPDDLDQIERGYVACYPHPQEAVAYAMIARRRARMVLSALRNLVRHLQTLREERKAILVVSEGWRLFGPDQSLASAGGPPRPPAIGIAGGQPAIGDSRTGVAGTVCDGDRAVLAGIDDRRDFKDLLDEANRANASFYPIDPRGLPVFDTAVPAAGRSTVEDLALLGGNINSLQTLAVNTDGLAVVNSNDFAKNLHRISDDLSSYYLLGYSSTNTKYNGKFRAISVRVKRPGVSVRARRGYLAPTEAEVKATEAASAAPPDPGAVALDSALATLEFGRPNQVLRLRGAYTWPARPGSTSGTVAQDKAVVARAFSPVFASVVVELDPAAARTPGWAGGGQLQASLVDPDGQALASSAATVSPASRSCLIRFVDSPLRPGFYFVRVKAEWSVLTTTEQVRIEVPEGSATSGMLGPAIVFRRGPYTGPAFQPTADLRFRKAERIRVDVPVAGPVDSIAGELLDRKGRPLLVPVTTTRREEEGAAFVAAEVMLAPLAAGDYVIQISAKRGERTDKVLTALRIVP